MTFAGVLVQSSSADPTAGVDVLGLPFAFVLPDYGEMHRHLQLFRSNASFGQSPPNGSKIFTLFQRNVSRSQTRHRQVGVSVKLQYGHVVSVCDVASPFGVDVSCDRIKDLYQYTTPCFCSGRIRSYLVIFRFLAVVYSAVDDGRQASGGANVRIHAVRRRQDPVTSEQRRAAHVEATATFS